MKVKEIMQSAFIVEKDVSLNDAAKIMSDKGIGSLLVVFNKKLKGIVTEKDLMRNFGKDKKISEIMTKNVITIEPNENIETALSIMMDKKIKRLPVTKNDSLIGIISIPDIAAHADEVAEDFLIE